MNVESDDYVPDASLSSVAAPSLFVAFDLTSLVSLLLRTLISLFFDIIIVYYILSIS